MNHLASVTDFFKSPKWGMNFLLGAVSILIPIVGPLALHGWHITGFWARRDETDPAKFPDFDFQFFVKYLGRGLWPFLVMMVVSLVVFPVLVILMFIPIVSFGLCDHQTGSGFPVILIVAICLIYPIVMMVFSAVMIPLSLRASITQDFGKSFDFGFIRSFLSRVWPEILVVMLFVAGLYLVAMVLTVITCYIGGIFTFPILIYAWHHLQKQLYQLHLSRGGEEIPASPGLSDLPPAFPL